MARPSTGRWALTIAYAAGALVALHAIAPLVSLSAFGAYVAAFLCITAVTLAVAESAPERRVRDLAWITLPVAALVAIVFLGPRAMNSVGAVVVLMALLAGGSLAGSILGQQIQHPGHLLPVVFVSSLADLFSVLHSAGPSKALVAAPRALAVLALPWPLIGSGEIVPILGVGDVVFAALYVAAARRHGLSVSRTLSSLAAAFVFTMLLVIYLQMSLPVLPALGIAMLGTHPQARRLRPEDRRQALMGMAVLGLLFTVLWLVR